MTSSTCLRWGGLLLVIASLVYVVYRAVPYDILAAILVGGVVSIALGWSKWKQMRKHGLVNFFSDKFKQLLLKKSILDVFSDLLYFPYFSEIIKAFVMAIIQKPSPQKLYKCFDDAPEDVREAIVTKGILHLAPQKIENLMLPEDWEDEGYGKKDTSWYNKNRYDVEAPKRPYNLTLRDKIVDGIKSKPWSLVFLLGLVAALTAKKYGKLEIQKILVKRGFEVGVIMCVLSMAALMLKSRKQESSKRMLKTK